MTASRQLGVALLIILLIWIIAYWRLFAPVIQAVEDIDGLKIGPGDSVGTHPDDLLQPAGVGDEENQIIDDAGSESIMDSNQFNNGNKFAREDAAAADIVPKPVTSNGGELSVDEDGSADEVIIIPPPPVTFPYVVKAGDTMDIIALQWFGSASKWVLIAQENPTVDPMKLRAGKTIRLPARDAILQDVDQAWLDEILKDTIYVVTNNDTLSSIAQQFYHDATLWPVIYEANRSVIPNPDSLKLGIELEIPPHQVPAE